MWNIEENLSLLNFPNIPHIPHNINVKYHSVASSSFSMLVNIL